MKKFFISATILTMALAANAQRTEGGDNLVKNGSFDDPELVQAVPGEWTWEPMSTCRNIENLPYWTVSTGGVWNGGIEVMDDPVLDLGDGDTRSEEDYQWLRFYTDTDNMWAAVRATTKVEGLEVGKAYKLEFVICGQSATVKEGQPDQWEQTPDMSVTINEVDGENLGKEIKNEDLKSSVELDWTRCSFDFNATATEMYIQFSFGGWMPDDKHTQAWMGIDNVDVYDPNGVMSVVADIVAGENPPVEYFNLQGIRVANPENGIFIRRQGSKVTKVAL